MVVVIVIGVLAALMVPSFVGQRANAELRSAARSLHAAARYGHDVAAIRGTTCRLLIASDGDHTRYRFEVEDPEQPGVWVPMGNALIPPTTLTPAVRLAQVHIAPIRRDPTTERAIYFYGDGTADPAAVQLTNGKSTWTILIEPNTGRADLVDDAVDASPNLREDLDA